MLIALMEGVYFELKIIRKKNRYAYVRVRPNRIIEVSAPVKMPQSSILELVHQKKAWILELSENMGETYNEEVTEILPVGEAQEAKLKLQAEARAWDALERIYVHVKPYGIPMPEIHIRFMSSRWGSTSLKTGRIWLNGYLLKLPEVYMDYVLLKQVLLLHFKKESADFYKSLANAMPQWHAYEQFLKNLHLPQKKMIASSPKLY